MQDRTRKAPALADVKMALDARPSALRGMLDDAHAADLADWLGSLELEDARRLFDVADVATQAEALQETSDAVLEQLVPTLSVERLVALVEELPPDEAVDVLAHLEDDVAQEVLRRIDFEDAKGLRALYEYPPESAGGIMTTEFDAFPSGTRVGDAIKALRREDEPAGEEGSGAYVLDASGRPLGHVTDRDLLTSPIHKVLDEIMERDLVLVTVDEDQEDVALQFTKYNLPSMPVVDLRGRLIGVVTSDDVVEVLELEAREDIQRLVGASAQEQTRLPVIRRVRQRLPLMGLTVLGGLATAKVLDWSIGLAASSTAVGEPSSILDTLRYVPIILGLAGNVGIQSSTILVRGLATGEVMPDRERAVLASEVTTGVIVGTLCGIVTGVVALFLEAGDGLAWSFGAALALAITIAVSWAALLGCVVPIVCRRIGIDPAIVAGPFLITLSDLSATAIFMVVAQVVRGLVGGVG